MLKRLTGRDWRGVSAALIAAMLVGGTAAVAADQIHSNEIKNHGVKRVDLAKGINKRIAKGLRRPKQIGPATPVPAGKTIHGAVGGDFHVYDDDPADPTPGSSDFGVDVTLPSPAANPLSDNDVYVNVSGWQDAGGQTAPTTTDALAGCSGSPSNPTAPAGKVCIYVAGADNALNVTGYSVLFGTEASPYGFKLKWDTTSPGDTFVDATWAYTAP